MPPYLKVHDWCPLQVLEMPNSEGSGRPDCRRNISARRSTSIVLAQGHSAVHAAPPFSPAPAVSTEEDQVRSTLTQTLVLGAASVLVTVACSSEPRGGFNGHSAATEPTGFGPGDGGTQGGQDGAVNECAAEKFEGKRVPLDLLFIVDSSGSMRDEAGGSNSSKWDAVKSAIQNFVTDQASLGLGMALKFFPARDSRAPASCTANQQCNAGGMNWGNCLFKVCKSQFGGFGMPWCDSDADCGGVQNDCVPLGECSALLGFGGYCSEASDCLGLFPSCNKYSAGFCEGASTCYAPEYGKPEVPMATLPANVSAITTALNRIPDGGTPMGPALDGALQYAVGRVQDNPNRAAAVVLVTDGFPSNDCNPYDIPTIASFAWAASNGSEHVKTFVVGVFNDAEKDKATTDLNKIADKGGTGQAIIISNGAQDVTQELVKALDSVRGQALPCEFEIPESSKGPLDYQKVNVNFSSSSGTVTLGYKGSASACGSGEGWYYDTDPATKKPSKIILCPTTCEGMESDTVSANVSVALGCATVVK
jgi:hypothetical protein